MANYWEQVTQERMGRRRLLKAGAAFSAGAASLALIGCGSDDGGDGAASEGAPSNAVTGSTGEPKQGGTFGTFFATVGSYNTVAFYHDGYNNSGITAYDRLITARLDNRRYVLEAAASVELAEPTKIVFKLKPGMVFQNKAPVNGHKVTSADILASQAYVKQLPNAENSGFVRNYVRLMEAPDESTVIYNLTSPLAYVFSSTYLANPTAQPILPKEMLEVLDTTPAIGSGPFELTDHTFGTKYTYKRFENYRDAKDKKPYFDKRETFSLVDPVAIEAAFRSEQIHVWPRVPLSQIDRLLGELDKSKFANLTGLSPGQSTINAMTNYAKGGDRPWKDIRFREALYRLTNRQQFIDLTLKGKAVIPGGPLQASLESHQITKAESDKFWKADVAAAKQLLSAMNYDLNQEFEVVTSNSTAVNTTWAEIWQQQLAQGGIKLRPVARPLAEILPKQMQTGAFDFWIGGQPGGDTPYRAMRNQHSDTLDQFNNVGLFDKSIDALIEKSETTTDKDENIKLVKQIQLEALGKYSTSINMFTQQEQFLYTTRLQNFENDPLIGQVFQTGAWFA